MNFYSKASLVDSNRRKPAMNSMTVSNTQPNEVDMQRRKGRKPWWQKRFFRTLLGDSVCENIDSPGMLAVVMLAGITGMLLGLATVAGIVYLLYEIIRHVWG
jgi:hypothetical protein